LLVVTGTVTVVGAIMTALSRCRKSARLVAREPAADPALDRGPVH
jgi:hypothetical protein